MTKITDETPIGCLTVRQLKEIMGIDRILGNLVPSQPHVEQIITIEEVVRLTGYSKATIYKLTSERKIPYHKPEHGGRRLYFRRDEIFESILKYLLKSVPAFKSALYFCNCSW